jgi:flavin reductase (DIM6/NTAB) family NADH-FMN oxidoreductase RutF
MKTKGKIETYYHYAFPFPAILVTCKSQEDETNIITLAWHTPISKKPPLYGISIAPSRYSHQLITKSKEFVVNFMPYTYTADIHFCGTHSGRSMKKIDQTRLRFEPSESLKTLRIKEAYAHLECRLHSHHNIGDHTMFIGEILHLSTESDSFKDSILDNTVTKPAFYLGNNVYTTIHESQQTF